MQSTAAQAGRRWPLDFMRTPWPALSLLQELEREAAPLSWRHAVAGQLRGAVAYIHFMPKGMARFHDIDASLTSLEKYWFSREGGWPIIVFADEASAEQQAASFSATFPFLNISVAIIKERDLTWPMSEHPTCSAGYRRAARFTSGPLWMHEALDGFSHILLIDTEFVLSHPVPWDPLRYMFEQNSDLAYWQTHYERTWNRTVYLTEVSKQFMHGRNLMPQVPELVSYWWDEGEVPGGSFPVNIYGCLFGGSMSFFRSSLYQSYFEELDSWPGFDEYCWSPQSILAIAAAFFLNDNFITEIWIYGRHQNSSKTPDEGWNDSKRGILPQSQRPTHLKSSGE
ncbi:MNT1 [Symbiodinium sp. CCMP2456]|nr:MNT1 [Symbiodinium sp. CCMP2456]